MISIHAVPSMSTVLEFLQLNKDISDLSDEILQLLAVCFDFKMATSMITGIVATYGD